MHQANHLLSNAVSLTDHFQSDQIGRKFLTLNLILFCHYLQFGISNILLPHGMHQIPVNGDHCRHDNREGLGLHFV